MSNVDSIDINELRLGFVTKYFQSNVPSPGSIDLFFSGKERRTQYIQLLLKIIVGYRILDNNNSSTAYYENIVFLVAPSTSTQDLLSVEEKMNVLVKSWGEEEVRVSFLQMGSSAFSHLEDAICKQQDRTAIIVLKSETYHHIENVIDISTNKTGKPRVITYDLNLPQNLLNTSARLAELLINKKIYIILDTTYIPHNFEIFNEHLDSYNNLGITGLEQRDENLVKQTQQIEGAMNHLRSGDLKIAFDIIDNSIEIEDKKLIKLQLLHEINVDKNFCYSPHILSFLETIEIPFDEKIDPRTLLKLANIAISAQGNKIAIQYLQVLQEKIDTISQLQQAYELSRKSGDLTLQSFFRNKIITMYPDSKEAISIQVLELIKDEKFAESVDLLEKNKLNSELSDFIKQFNQIVCNKGDIVFFLKGYVANTNQQLSVALHLVIEFYLNKKEFQNALICISTIEDSNNKIDLFPKKIDLLKQALLHPDFIEEGIFREILSRLLHAISDNPHNAIYREKVIGMLDQSSAGIKGISMLISLFIDKLKDGIAVIADEEMLDHSIIYTDDEFMEVVKNCYEYLANSLVITGVTIIPKELLPNDPIKIDLFISKAFRLISDEILEKRKVEDIQLIDMLITIVINAAPYSSDPNSDIKFIKNIAITLNRTSFDQKARDYAEQILQITYENEERIVLAWLAIANIYQMQNQNLAALFYINCALSKRIIFHNKYYLDLIFTALKVIRNIGIIPLAIEILELVKQSNSEISNSLEFQFLELTIRFSNIMDSNRVLIQQNMLKLLDDTADLAEKVLTEHGDVTAIYSFLGQIVSIAEQNNIIISESLKKTLLRLNSNRSSEPNSIFSEFISQGANDFSQIFEVYTNIMPSRYATDRSFDHKLLYKMCSAFLNNIEGKSENDLIFTLEIMADETLPESSSQYIDHPFSLYKKIDEPVDIAKQISKNTGSIFIWLSINEKEQLVVGVLKPDGSLKVNISHEFQLEKFREWKKSYPRIYNTRELDANKKKIEHDFLYVYNSCAGISLEDSLELFDNLIFILDPKIHTLVPKLLQYKGNFFGYFSKNISLTPSLAWLNNDYSHDRTIKRALNCWISGGVNIASDDPLPPLQRMLDDFKYFNVLEPFGINLNIDNSIPKHLQNSKLAIVGAHGDVTGENHAFKRISDEHDLSIDYKDLAQSLAGCEVVILFVCHAGRFNTHIESKTTISLAKELLKKGCSTVISSPWPLDVSVAAPWLLDFLANWVNKNSQVCDAVSIANEKWADRSSYDVLKYLALTIYGNPFIKFEQEQ